MRMSESAIRGVPRPTYLPVVAHSAVESPVKSLREIERDMGRCGEMWGAIGRAQEPAVIASPGGHPHRHDESGYYCGVLRRLLTAPRTYYGHCLLRLVVLTMVPTRHYSTAYM